MKTKFEKVASKKSPIVRQKIWEALEILLAVKVPLNDLTHRRLEKTAMAFLAVANLKPNSDWSECGNAIKSPILRTREIITFMNEHYEENISSGSYDDIRRKDLIRVVGMELVKKSAKNPDADTNDGTRGYAVSESFSKLAQSFGTNSWHTKLAEFPLDEKYNQQFHTSRKMAKLSVSIAPSVKIDLDDGPHNKIQKAIIEEFLPRYGYNAKILYVGDTSEKTLLKFNEEMQKIGLNIEDRGMLPDIVAYSTQKKWLYLIEAVHSSNPLSPERCIELRRTVLSDYKSGVVYVTAFLSMKDATKWLGQIAWETEVWLADTPDHLIHFNGGKFLGPH